jgi:hypothetical protein
MVQMVGRIEQHTANTGLAKVAVQCSAETFVVNQSLVLRINICGENRHLRQARKRYAQYGTLSPIKFILNYGFLLKMVIRSGIRFERFDFFLV